MKNLPTRLRVFRKPDENIDATGSVTEGCDNTTSWLPLLSLLPDQDEFNSSLIFEEMKPKLYD